MTLERRSRTWGAASGLLLLTGSAVTRFAVFTAGIASAKDPRYTVVPQRERLAAKEDSGGTTALAGETGTGHRPPSR
jgi:hypothetical protein